MATPIPIETAETAVSHWLTRANAQHIAKLNERIKLLEEQFRLAQFKRFAPSIEKLKDRVFDEAEQMATAALADVDEDGAHADAPPDVGLPEPDKPAGHKRGRKPLPAELPRQRIEYGLTEDQKICPCCQGMHRLGEEVGKQLHIDAKVSILQHVRFKYAWQVAYARAFPYQFQFS